MAVAKKAAKKAPEFKVKDLSTELGLPVKEGKVTKVRERYFVTVGRKTQEIPIGEINVAADLKALVGQVVPVIFADRTIVAVGYPKKPWCYILCYVPAPDILVRIRPELRVSLINLYAKNGVINDKLQHDLLDVTPIVNQ